MRILKILSINLIFLAITFSGIEFLFRLLFNFNSNFYGLDSRTKPGLVNVHPYGEIPINSGNYYDNEWEETKTKKRFAYFGDSVVYGVGAGYPFRITEYLDQFNNEVEHVNISGGLGANFLGLGSANKISKLLEVIKVDKLVYVMNLNDIGPLAYQNSDKKVEDLFAMSNLAKFMQSISFIDKKFRGNSVFYTFFRLKIKNFLVTKLGLNASGFKAIELEPLRFSTDIKKSARNLAFISNDLLAKRINFCILILPYEMQISKDAARTYRQLGIYFEDEFLEYKTQQIFIDEFQKFSNIDIYKLGQNFPQENVGTFFVFNKGDKIDFNHPNRLGHKFLSKEISEKNLCY